MVPPPHADMPSPKANDANRARASRPNQLNFMCFLHLRRARRTSPACGETYLGESTNLRLIVVAAEDFRQSHRRAFGRERVRERRAVHPGKSLGAKQSPGAGPGRSEERRVGKECRSRWS